MATIENNLASRQPLPQKRGLDDVTRQRVERVASENLGGDSELTRGLFSIIQTFVVKPGKVFKDDEFPVLIFTIMILIDILDIIVGIFDETGVGWFIRVVILIILPMAIVIFWAKEEGEKFKKEIDTAIDEMTKFAQKAERYATKMGGKGAVKSAKKGANKGVKKLLSKRAKKVIIRKAMFRILRLLVIGIIPILTFFGLWSYFIYAFHASKVKEKENMTKTINNLYIIHANRANQTNQG